MTWFRWCRLACVAGVSILVLTGCGVPHWWSRPGNSEADFKRDNTTCIQKATKSDPKKGEVIDAALHSECLNDLGYFTVDPGKGWHDGRK